MSKLRVGRIVIVQSLRTGKKAWDVLESDYHTCHEMIRHIKELENMCDYRT